MRSSQTCVKKDGCEMYNLIEQNVSEDRAIFHQSGGNALPDGEERGLMGKLRPTLFRLVHERVDFT